MFPRFLLLVAALFTVAVQAQETGSDMVRVTVQMNSDGSRTTYEWDIANRKATATTMVGEKVRENIRYVLDEKGRFQTGEVFGPNDKLHFRTRYKYDNGGRLEEESQLNADGALLHRIVHTYDAGGKEIGYAIYDATGKLEHREGKR